MGQALEQFFDGGKPVTALRSVQAEADESACPVVAWEVDIRGRTCICFATTKAKAQWLATKGFWEAYGERKGEWPRAVAHRAERYDKSPLRLQPNQKAWGEDYVQ